MQNEHENIVSKHVKGQIRKAALVGAALLDVSTVAAHAQGASTPPPGTGGGPLQRPALYKLEDGLLRWPLPANDRDYGAIDGRHLHQYVEELAAISRRYRDSGHPQFWGRITGTSADAETAQWMVDKFNKIGLSDVHIQPFDLPPQWMPQSWEITATGSGKTLHLETAQPAYLTVATGPEGLDLEAAYVGTGSEADYIGRDVRGKAVFIFSMPLPGSLRHTAQGTLRLAESKGAAAIFSVIALPGNIRTQLYQTRTNVPTFSMGMEDGDAIRDLIGKGGASNPPHAKVRLDVQMTPNLKSGTVWTTLPGTTDETIYIIAHRDAWFEGGTDNGSGVATMVGLAEYFAKIPKAKRRRTIVFVGQTGHHNGANMSGGWLLAHRDVQFEKTALLINCEHTATIQTYLLGDEIREANTYTGMLWYAGGPRRPKLEDIAVKAFREFGVATYATPELTAPVGEITGLWPYVPSVQASDYNMFFHSDQESPDKVPWTGLESITRAYAKIIDGVNTLDLSDLVRPPEPPPGGRIAGPVITDFYATPSVVPINTSFTLTSVTNILRGIVAESYSVDNGRAVPMATAGPWLWSGAVDPLPWGVHTICAGGFDLEGNQAAANCMFVPVYDPSGGFVTGGGWIMSPVGAYAPNPSLSGKATFGFVSKYQKGATVPSGNTQLQFSVAGFNFNSTSCDGLVVAGAKAQFKGSGSINGTGDYGFMLTAIDGQLSGGGGTDKFRIKIWDKTSGGVIYDNQFGASDASDPATVLGGGSIVIHE